VGNSKTQAIHCRGFRPEVEFTFKPQGNQTEVTLIVTGEKNFMAKAFCLFMSMDNMIGGKFEKALADLKAIAESSVKL
jgi:hypothetical protein